MFDEERMHDGDPLSVGRAIGYGLLFGTLLWAVVLGGLAYFFFQVT